MTWYVAVTQAGAEIKALYALTERGHDVYLPTTYPDKRSHKKHKPIALFPRYLFINMIEGVDDFNIKVIPYVSYIVKTGGIPAKISELTMDRVRVTEALCQPVRDFEKEEEVRVKYGSLAGLAGTFSELRPKYRGIFMLNILGNIVPVDLPLNYLEPV